MRAISLTSALLLLATNGVASAQASTPGMNVATPEVSEPNHDHAGHDAAEPSTPENEAEAPGNASTEVVDHSGHDMADMPSNSSQIGTAPAPAPPEDHAADAIFDPADMARARAAAVREMTFTGSSILFDLAEYRAREGGDGYRWEGEAWFGGDINRLLLKTEGEGTFGEPIDDLEVQALYSRAISPFWNAHVGLRHDIVPNPSLTYAVAGVEGIAPYWLHLTGQLFLSDKGDVSARMEGSYDERITQRLILQPRAEFNLSAQDVPAIGVGSGLSEFELGVRLRYEIRKEYAPYVGVEWSKKTGDTARYAQLAGEDPDTVDFVAGVRFWF
ncbi:copper resistance protein B [Altererythrobacter sp. Root672]|uniref:copper resistance protein B n=1 Tax=Altererythrobacter sp. Root672 TaxID=1736584 RepID=UPI0006FC4A40|nr:copper resistance protein B [Altererythrobacter sp. Root672]KRA81243.1 copper resistance protein CopB [Altererythrobacter sp. Root672]